MLPFVLGAVYGTGVVVFTGLAFVLTAGFPSQGDSWKLYAFAIFWPIAVMYGVTKAAIHR